VLDRDGVPDFDALASRKYDQRARLYAFDMLDRDGEDLHSLPLAEDVQCSRPSTRHFAPHQIENEETDGGIG
jgi:hypothetical protein